MSYYCGFAQSKYAEERGYTLSLSILEVLVSLEDLSLTCTISFSALMPEGFFPTNHSTSSTRCCILNAVSLTDHVPETRNPQQSSRFPTGHSQCRSSQATLRMFCPALFSDELEGWKKWLRDLNREEVVTAQLGEPGILFTWRYAERNKPWLP